MGWVIRLIFLANLVNLSDNPPPQGRKKKGGGILFHNLTPSSRLSGGQLNSKYVQSDHYQQTQDIDYYNCAAGKVLRVIILVIQGNFHSFFNLYYPQSLISFWPNNFFYFKEVFIKLIVILVHWVALPPPPFLKKKP